MLGDGDHLLWSASNPPVIVCTGKRSGVTPLSAEQLGYGAKCGKCGLTLKAAEIGDGFCAKCYEKYNAQMDTEEARAQGAP